MRTGRRHFAPKGAQVVYWTIDTINISLLAERRQKDLPHITTTWPPEIDSKHS
jgi:hypothetical protein